VGGFDAGGIRDEVEDEGEAEADEGPWSAK